MKIFATFVNLFDPVKFLKNIAYMLMAMPLGIAYFVMLTVGFSLGMGLSVLGVGLFILAGMLVLARSAGWFEAKLAYTLLDADVEPSSDMYYDNQQSLFENAKRVLAGGNTLRSLAFLLLKFPFGIVTFVLTIVSLALPFGLMSAPFTYNNINTTIMLGTNRVDTPIEAIIAALCGFLLLPISYGVIRSLAASWRNLSERLLSDSDYVPQKQKRKRDTSHLEEVEYVSGYYYDGSEEDEEAVSLRKLMRAEAP